MNIPRNSGGGAEVLAAIFIILLVIALIVLGPLAFIWAVNTLFSLQIKYTLLNWFAAFILLMLVGKPSVKRNKD